MSCLPKLKHPLLQCSKEVACKAMNLYINLGVVSTDASAPELA